MPIKKQTAGQGGGAFDSAFDEELLASLAEIDRGAAAARVDAAAHAADAGEIESALSAVLGGQAAPAEPKMKPLQTVLQESGADAASPVAGSAGTGTPVSGPDETAAPVSRPDETAAPVSRPVETVAPVSRPAEAAAPASRPAETSVPEIRPAQAVMEDIKPLQPPVRPAEPESLPSAEPSEVEAQPYAEMYNPEEEFRFEEAQAELAASVRAEMHVEEARTPAAPQSTVQPSEDVFMADAPEAEQASEAAAASAESPYDPYSAYTPYDQGAALGDGVSAAMLQSGASSEETYPDAEAADSLYDGDLMASDIETAYTAGGGRTEAERDTLAARSHAATARDEAVSRRGEGASRTVESIVMTLIMTAALTWGCVCSVVGLGSGNKTGFLRYLTRETSAVVIVITILILTAVVTRLFAMRYHKWKAFAYLAFGSICSAILVISAPATLQFTEAFREYFPNTNGLIGVIYSRPLARPFMAAGAILILAGILCVILGRLLRDAE